MVWWLRLCTSNVEGSGSIPGQETKVPHAVKVCGHLQKKNYKTVWMKAMLKAINSKLHNAEGKLSHLEDGNHPNRTVDRETN